MKITRRQLRKLILEYADLKSLRLGTSTKYHPAAVEAVGRVGRYLERKTLDYEVRADLVTDDGQSPDLDLYSPGTVAIIEVPGNYASAASLAKLLNKELPAYHYVAFEDKRDGMGAHAVHIVVKGENPWDSETNDDVVDTYPGG